MKRVYKYELPRFSTVKMELPAGAVIISVINQREMIVMYAEVPEVITEMEVRDIHVVQTGNAIPVAARRFIGTVIMFNGTYVAHIYE